MGPFDAYLPLLVNPNVLHCPTIKVQIHKEMYENKSSEEQKIKDIFMSKNINETKNKCLEDQFKKAP